MALGFSSLPGGIHLYNGQIPHLRQRLFLGVLHTDPNGYHDHHGAAAHNDPQHSEKGAGLVAA